MSLAAINEQLLRSIGVGLALCGNDLTVRFCNDVFADWFGRPDPGTPLGAVFDSLDMEELRATVAQGGRFSTEVRLKKKRRQLIVALTAARTEATDPDLIVIECQNITRIRELESMIDSYSTMVERNARDLQRQKEKVEKLLLNVMPRAAYEEFMTFGAVTPQSSEASIIVVRFDDFEARFAGAAPAGLVGEINEIFTAFDRIGEQFGCERIKTTGDTYVAVAGLMEPGVDHGHAAWSTASRFVRYLLRRNEGHPSPWAVRVGVASGQVIGSVVGAQKYVYDVFGPAMTRASALSDIAAPQEVVIDGALAESLRASETIPEPEELGLGLGAASRQSP